MPSGQRRAGAGPAADRADGRDCVWRGGDGRAGGGARSGQRRGAQRACQIKHRSLRAAFARRRDRGPDTQRGLVQHQAGHGNFCRADDVAGGAAGLTGHSGAAGFIAKVSQIAPGQNKGVQRPAVRRCKPMSRARSHQRSDKHRQKGKPEKSGAQQLHHARWMPADCKKGNGFAPRVRLCRSGRSLTPGRAVTRPRQRRGRLRP